MKQFFLLLFAFLLVFANESAAQYKNNETRLKNKEDFRNRIGAELPDDTRRYLYKKTVDGRDSVDIYSYTMYNYPFKQNYTYEGRSPYFLFVGILKDGAMENGRLNYQNIVYTGDFKNNKAHGIGTLTLTNTLLPNRAIEFKGLFADGIPIRGNLKTDFDSSGVPHLFYSGEVLLLNEFPFNLLMHGQGALLRTSPVPVTSFFFNHSIGANNSYYEGQFYYGACTGFGIYNFFFPAKEKNSNLHCGLVMADLSLHLFHVLPINLDDNVIDKAIFADTGNAGLRRLLPGLANARSSYYMYNGRRYAGLSYNNKPYGIGFMEDGDGFREVGFWHNGEKILTQQLLTAVLPDSAVLKPYVVKNRVPLIYHEYNKRKGKFEPESVMMDANVYHFGKMADGKMQGWGWRMAEIPNGGLFTNASAGKFSSSVVISDKPKETLPAAESIFDIAYEQVFGTGQLDQTIVGITNAARYRFYSGATHYQTTKLLKPDPYNGIALGVRDANMLAISEYRSRREYDMVGTEKYLKQRIKDWQIAEAKKKEAYDALFLSISNPTKYDMQQCAGKFYMDRSGSYLYRIKSVDEYKSSFTATVYYVLANGNVQSTILTAAQLLSSGNFRKVQNYVTCKSCGGAGTYTTTYKYTADYEYTLGAKITTTSTKTERCGCGCGLEPEIYGARRDW